MGSTGAGVGAGAGASRSSAGFKSKMERPLLDAWAPEMTVNDSEVTRKKPPATEVMRAKASAAPRPLISEPEPPPPMPRAPPSERCNKTSPIRLTQTSK